MEELVNKLAELQAELKLEELKANEASLWTDERIAKAEEEVKALRAESEKERLPYINNIDDINSEIRMLQGDIVEVWDRRKNTVQFDAGTLKFTTRKSMEIVDGGRLLEHIIENTSTTEAVDKYLKGFLLTPTKAYVNVHELGEGIAKINSKTTVKLEQKSG